MRQVREVLRLKLVGGVPIREIARRIGVAASTVRATIRRFQAAGLSWPLPEEMTDAVLEAKLASGCLNPLRKIDPGNQDGRRQRRHRRQTSWSRCRRRVNWVYQTYFSQEERVGLNLPTTGLVLVSLVGAVFTAIYLWSVRT
jgi:hypothetical protein